jgi:hypothetical protein
MHKFQTLQCKNNKLLYRHKTVLVSPWLYCIDKWHAESLQDCPGLNIFKWVAAGGIFPKDEVEQQLMYFKNKVFTISSSSLPEYIWSPMKGVWNSSHSQLCRSISCYLVQHNLVMAPKASLTYLQYLQWYFPYFIF